MTLHAATIDGVERVGMKGANQFYWLGDDGWLKSEGYSHNITPKEAGE